MPNIVWQLLATICMKPTTTQVSTGEEGILSTHCECPRGENKCSHADALAIFAIHNFSCTDTTCQWKKPKAAKRTHSVEELLPPLNKQTAEDRDWLRDRLRGRFSGMSWLLSPEPEEEPFTLAQKIYTILVSCKVHPHTWAHIPKSAITKCTNIRVHIKSIISIMLPQFTTILASGSQTRSWGPPVYAGFVPTTLAIPEFEHALNFS